MTVLIALFRAVGPKAEAIPAGVYEGSGQNGRVHGCTMVAQRNESGARSSFPPLILSGKRI
jgi:hypothetical protein